MGGNKKKRRGGDAGIDTQASKETLEWREAQDDGEGNTGGTFERAGASVMKGRKILKVRRKKKKKKSGSAAQANSMNPFASIQLAPSAGSGAGSATAPPVFTFASNKKKSLFPGASAAAASALTSVATGKAEGGTVNAPGAVPAKTSDMDYRARLGALNLDFAAFVKKMMREKPSENWMAGVSDYLAAAKKIMAKENRSNSKTTTPEESKTKTKLPETTSSSPPNKSKSTAVESASPSANNSDETEEHEVRAKVLAWRPKTDEDEAAWSSKGVGRLVLMAKGKKARLLLRAESTGKVLFNAPMFSGMSVNAEGAKAVSLICVSYMVNAKTGKLEAEYGGKLTKYVLKVKTPDAAKSLLDAIQNRVPK